MCRPALAILLAIPLTFVALHTLIRIVRHFHKFPIPEFLAGAIDNPFRRRIQPPAWEFSSYRDYVGLRHGTLPTPDIVLAQFPSREAYQAFVEAYMPADRGQIEDLLFD